LSIEVFLQETQASWLAPSNIEIWKNGRMEIFKALCASLSFLNQRSLTERLQSA
jgi:hypothetical protein